MNEKLERWLETLCVYPDSIRSDDYPELGSGTVVPCKNCEGCKAAQLIRAYEAVLVATRHFMLGNQFEGHENIDYTRLLNARAALESLKRSIEKD